MLLLLCQVDWQHKGSSYWVRFIHIELLGFQPSTPAPHPIKVGDRVKVKASVKNPKYKWGSVNHNSIGVVTSESSYCLCSNSKYKMLERREECNSYLTHVCRDHWSGENPLKRLNIQSFQPTLWVLSPFQVFLLH